MNITLSLTDVSEIGGAERCCYFLEFARSEVPIVFYSLDMWGYFTIKIQQLSQKNPMEVISIILKRRNIFFYVQQRKC